jgi:Zn-finger nucleic acid-binding protein
LDEPSESAGESLLDVARDPSVAVDLEARRICPKCADRPVMMRHFTSVKRSVTIDECPECAGVWLDAGELRSIRAEFPSDEARQQAAETYFAELFDGPLDAERAKTEVELARARRFASAFRFLCPSWYIPGKQDWGAF